MRFFNRPMTAYFSNNGIEPQWDFEKRGLFRKNRKSLHYDEGMKGVVFVSFRSLFSKCPP
jgi:hypothetical protein